MDILSLNNARIYDTAKDLGRPEPFSIDTRHEPVLVISISQAPNQVWKDRWWHYGLERSSVPHARTDIGIVIQVLGRIPQGKLARYECNGDNLFPEIEPRGVEGLPAGPMDNMYSQTMRYHLAIAGRQNTTSSFPLAARTISYKLLIAQIELFWNDIL